MKHAHASALAACLMTLSSAVFAQSTGGSGAPPSVPTPGYGPQRYTQPAPAPAPSDSQSQSAPQQGYSQPSAAQQGYSQQPTQQQGYSQQATQQQGYSQQAGYPQKGNALAPGYPSASDPGQAGNKQKAFIQPQDPSAYGPGALYPVQAFGANGAPGATPETTAGENKEDFGHHGQINLRGEFITGYRMLVRYGNSPRCNTYDPAKSAKDQQKVCGYGAAPGMGLALGFAIVDYFEPFAFVRLGLANEAAETNQGKLVQGGVGARIYTMASSRVKVFFSPWIGVDTTTGPLEPIGQGPVGSPGYDDGMTKVKEGSYKTDILAHIDVGPQVEIARGLGVYLAGGLTFQAARYFGTTADLAIGLQARAP